MIYSVRYASPFGNILLAGSAERIAGLWFEGQKYFGETVPEWMPSDGGQAALDAGRRWLDDYFAGKRPPVSRLALAPEGGEFRQTVWRLLLEIPYGKTVSYGVLAKEVARRLGKRAMSAQAVGGAVGHNPISIMIPCHRVVGANGALTGYAGGIAVKEGLLRHEGADVVRLCLRKERE